MNTRSSESLRTLSTSEFRVVLCHDAREALPSHGRVADGNRAGHTQRIACQDLPRSRVGPSRLEVEAIPVKLREVENENFNLHQPRFTSIRLAWPIK